MLLGEKKTLFLNYGCMVLHVSSTEWRLKGHKLEFTTSFEGKYSVLPWCHKTRDFFGSFNKVGGLKPITTYNLQLIVFLHDFKKYSFNYTFISWIIALLLKMVWKFPGPLPPWGRLPPPHGTHAPRHSAGSPARRASPGSPGRWTHAPDSARWTTGCGKEKGTVKKRPTAGLATRWLMPFSTFSVKMTFPLSNFVFNLPTLLMGTCGFHVINGQR